MIEFGVGKLSFIASHRSEADVDKEAPADKNLAMVRAALNELPNVTDLHISNHGDSISFVISIPSHLHGDVRYGHRASERFRVRTISAYYSDLTFVASLDPIDPFSGSEGVRIVREQLTKQLKENANVALSFQGPSPFHADFRLYTPEEYGSETEESPPIVDFFEGKINLCQGYDQASFVYNSILFEDELDALDALQFRLSDELSLFYSLAEDRHLRLQRASDIGRDTERLIDLHSQRGFKGAYNRLIRSGREARTLALAVLHAEYTVSEDREQFRVSAESLYSHGDGYFRRFLDEEAAEEFLSLVDNGAKVVRHLESGRTKEVEIAIVAGATVVGGLSGGAVSALMGAG